jgi:hypothetical protein
MAHEGWLGGLVSRRALYHALADGGSQDIAEGRHHWGDSSGWCRAVVVRRVCSAHALVSTQLCHLERCRDPWCLLGQLGFTGGLIRCEV